MLEHVGFAQEMHHEVARYCAQHVRRDPVFVVELQTQRGPPDQSEKVLHEQEPPLLPLF